MVKQKKIGYELLLLPVKFYQYIISPLTPASCRHIPTCSEYSKEAVRKFGPVTGGKIAVNRILRCHPWGTHGWDPVPVVVVKKMKLKPVMKSETINYEGDGDDEKD
jgi:hypothetical protein